MWDKKTHPKAHLNLLKNLTRKIFIKGNNTFRNWIYHKLDILGTLKTPNQCYQWLLYKSLLFRLKNIFVSSYLYIFVGHNQNLIYAGFDQKHIHQLRNFYQITKVLL